jgi:hypothetical protein
MKRTLIVTFAGWLCLAPHVAAQGPAPPEKTGLKVGEKAPAFRLKDQTGKQRTFDDVRKDADYVALVFYRSAGW